MNHRSLSILRACNECQLGHAHREANPFFSALYSLQIEASNNVMYDRRVVRGNTYAAQVVTQSAQRESMRLRQEHARRLRLEALRRRQVREQSGRSS